MKFVDQGGIGKTTLACQIGLWALDEIASAAMLGHPAIPIVFDDFPLTIINHEKFVDLIADEIQNLSRSMERPSRRLVRNLLKTGRALVIADRISEWKSEGVSKLLNLRGQAQVNSLIVSSRSETLLENTSRIKMEPPRIDADYISVFLGDYLSNREMRDQFPKTEFYPACQRLAEIVHDGGTTACFLTMYADIMVYQKTAYIPEESPRTLPDLVIKYVQFLNRSSMSDMFSDDDVVRDASFSPRLGWRGDLKEPRSLMKKPSNH